MCTWDGYTSVDSEHMLTCTTLDTGHEVAWPLYSTALCRYDLYQ